MIAQRDKSTPQPEHDMPLHAQSSLQDKKWVLLLIGALVFVGSLTAYSWYASTHLPPRTQLGQIGVGGLTRAEALERFRAQSLPLPSSITLTVDHPTASISATLTAEELQLRKEPEPALASVWTPEQSLQQKIASFTRGLFLDTKIDTPTLFDSSIVTSTLETLATANDQPGRDPSVTLKTSGAVGSLVADAGELGFALDSTASAQLIEQQLQSPDLRDATGALTIALPTRVVGTVLSSEEVQNLEKRAQFLVGKRLRATAERLDLSLNDQEIIALLQPSNGWNTDTLHNIVTEWQKQTGTQPQEPELEYDATSLKVTKFTPPRNGRTIQVEPTVALVIAGLDELATDPDTKVVTKELSLSETPPTKSLAAMNSLGLQERIGFGESYYAHSIPNRIHNVRITAERIDDVIIPPGAEFSFNKTLGDVSSATGYRAAYVIRNGKTELGDGGGVCQVSTTLFRAVLNAGLEVTKRLPHSYRVSYYELDRKPGMDATVYAGDVDFRFKNDTPNHILLHTVTDEKNTYMYVELYGTSDGRRTEIVDHKTWDARPAPASQYFPDPSLPPGKVVQIDWSASGIRASFTNVVYDKNNTELRRDTYVSNYRPWSAKFLQGV